MTQSQQSSLNSAVKYVMAVFRGMHGRKEILFISLYTLPQLTEGFPSSQGVSC